MGGTRSRTARGIVVLAVAGGLTAGALLVPAGAASFATKKFVNKKVKKVAKQVADLNQLVYVESPIVLVPDQGIGQAEAVCPAGFKVTGGGGFASMAEGVQLDSYPSHGVGFNPDTSIAPAGHTAWVFEYAATGGDEDIRAYAVCAQVDASSGFAPGNPPIPARNAERPAA
ncbi:MAG: hypothetical protein ACRDHB_03105 [Actinomycetota bacterium]